MAKLSKKKKINLEEKKITLVKSRIADQQAVYRVNISSTHSTLSLDSIICGDAYQVLQNFPDHFVDLIVTSPPYTDKRTNSYGGIHPDKYVQWFFTNIQRTQKSAKTIWIFYT